MVEKAFIVGMKERAHLEASGRVRTGLGTERRDWKRKRRESKQTREESAQDQENTWLKRQVYTEVKPSPWAGVR